MFSAFRNTTLAAIVAGLALSSPARAGIITLDVSGTMSVAAGFGVACSPTCTLGGDIVIDNSLPAPGTILSEHVTATGFLPTVGPFTVNGGISGISGGVDLSISDAASNLLSLLFATPTAGSLVGYAGGPLSAATGISPPFFVTRGSSVRVRSRLRLSRPRWCCCCRRWRASGRCSQGKMLGKGCAERQNLYG